MRYSDLRRICSKHGYSLHPVDLDCCTCLSKAEYFIVLHKDPGWVHFRCERCRSSSYPGGLLSNLDELLYLLRLS